MLNKDYWKNINISGKNILRDNQQNTLNNNFNNIYSNNEFSNMILNSNLENGNLIK
ncbi:hypothetical protein UT300005_36940 [Clostridium sp. CTA-5]